MAAAPHERKWRRNPLECLQNAGRFWACGERHKSFSLCIWWFSCGEVVVEATKNSSGYACALKQHRHDRLKLRNPVRACLSPRRDVGAQPSGETFKSEVVRLVKPGDKI